MSDEGEKTCPLCAEEMDLTDQQLKPCKCGYEICVWCWHHIMDMAEKEETEGRCPACRSPYDKEKIVGMAPNCERLVAEINVEKRKLQRAKTKTSEGRKQLSSVRVIQRNLVYIVGLPLNLADEDLLQRKEYFGQYGKVLKVSLSRTSAGNIQQFPNNTCSVYITYSKEEEAVRCIQSVHGFILEGRSLRACFGTTKYCHAWLRNVPCTNPDCLYLHEIGSQEDSFTKDEIISAYTRSRVQQITGVANNMQRRAGNVLPPPADDYCSNSCSTTGKPPVKSGANNSVPSARGSPPSTSSGRSGVLPAAASWGTRASNCQSSVGSLVCPNGPSKQKPDAVSASMAFSTAVVGTSQVSTLASDIGKRHTLHEESHLRQHTKKLESSEILKQNSGENPRPNVLEISVTPLAVPASMGLVGWLPSSAETADDNTEIKMPPVISHYSDREANISDLEKDRCVSTDGEAQKLCSDMPSFATENRINDEHSELIHANGLRLDNLNFPGAQGLQQRDLEKFQAHLTSPVVSKAATSVVGTSASSETCDWLSDALTPGMQKVPSEMVDKFNHQSPLGATVDNQASVPHSSQSYHPSNHFRSQLQHTVADGALSYSVNPAIVNKNAGESLATNASTASVVSNGYLESFSSCTSSLDDTSMLPSGEKGNDIGRFHGEVVTVDSNPTLDMESSIISNILSLDLDSWDDPLTSPQNLTKLLREPDKQHGSLKSSSPWKAQNSNQSRFSFARQDEPRNQLFDVGSSLNDTVQASMNNSFSHAFPKNREPHLHRLGNGFGFYQRNAELSDNFSSSNSIFSINKPSVSRAQISAPPGFSLPSRPPPPGFSSYERNDQYFDLKTGNHSHDISSLVRNPYHASPSGNASAAGDIEFMDPAILAVGKGRLTSGGVNNSGLDMRPIFPSQAPAPENDSKLQLLMQRSLTPNQNLRYTEVRDGFSPHDGYGFSSRHMEQSQSSNLSPLSQFSLHQSRNSAMSNGHWDGWNELQAGSDIGIAEILRNDRLGFNKLYSDFEDSKYQMPSSANLYNRTFGM